MAKQTLPIHGSYLELVAVLGNDTYVRNFQSGEVKLGALKKLRPIKLNELLSLASVREGLTQDMRKYVDDSMDDALHQLVRTHKINGENLEFFKSISYRLRDYIVVSDLLKHSCMQFKQVLRNSLLGSSFRMERFPTMLYSTLVRVYTRYANTHQLSTKTHKAMFNLLAENLNKVQMLGAATELLREENSPEAKDIGTAISSLSKMI